MGKLRFALVLSGELGDAIPCKEQLVFFKQLRQADTSEVWCFAPCPDTVGITAEDAAEVLCGCCISQLCMQLGMCQDHGSDSCCDPDRS